ncbi:hypothetical protein QMO14_16810 [Variovorax sp. CAN2819]|uniref:hypothetical protein n=1 Tax=Variovorax sp. CAN15 TaxID=3046727 RepID=UPI002649A9BF|nr:hypothetical protein [Variovorax sp. CAN15]MDN6885268.1 hypothetical protein [Variovorax sp. CAN15]
METIYTQINDSLTDTKTLATHLKVLGAIRKQSEDTNLIALIDGAIYETSALYQNIKIKSQPLALIRPDKLIGSTQAGKIEKLFTTCKRMIAIKKPEWQVLAERNGWTPPAAK